MKRVACPNCRSVVPADPHCVRCRAPFKSHQPVNLDELSLMDDIASPPIAGFSLDELKETSLRIYTDLDPHLQREVARAQEGIERIASASTRSNEVAVIAKVRDLSAWENLTEVRTMARIGRTADDGTNIVTARIPISSIESIKQKPFVVSLKGGQRLRPQLIKTIEETASKAQLLPAGNQTNGGRGTIIGIVDFGFDFVHVNFRNADAACTSRALAIWDQAATPASGGPFGFGTLHIKKDIDAALSKSDPYQELGFGPPTAEPGEVGTHGTHVADIAAGNGAVNAPGVAPNADIIFVEASLSDAPTGAAVVASSFGDTAQILEALRFIFDHAGTRPCSINLSLATNGGPHDGTTLVEQGIDRLLIEATNRAVTIAAANSFNQGIHTAGSVRANEFVDLIWDVRNDDSTNNELEVWYSRTDLFAVEVIAPDLQSKMTVGPNETKALKAGNQIVLLAANRVRDPNNLDNQIAVFLEAGLPHGQWRIRLHGRSVIDGRFHAWIERDDGGQSRFDGPPDNTHTLGSISCGRETITVGSYDAHFSHTPLSMDSSSGPTRDGRSKPEVSAPGVKVFAARSSTDTGVPHTAVTHKSGTSMAAPAVTGIAALILSEASNRGISLSSKQLREIITNAARRDPPPGLNFDKRFGEGRVSGAGCILAVMQLASSLLRS
jgi:subtilisin family serine protease